MTDLIKTIHKDKIPKGWSYPVGAERVSELLNDVPQYSRIGLFFDDRGQYWKSAFTRTVKEKGEIKILEIHNSFFSSDDYDYMLRIYAVPSEQRHNVKSIFEEIILPRLSSYLRNADHNNNDQLYFRAYFTLGSRGVRIDE